MQNILSEIDKYAGKHSTAEDPVLKELAEYTQANVPAPQMQIGHVEGNFLKLLVKISGAKKVLEIGTYTGYSALAMAMGLPDDGKIITLDINEDVVKVAQEFWKKSPHGRKIELKLGQALETIQELDEEFDLVFIDADKSNYINYYKAVFPKIKSGGLILVDNALRGGAVINPQSQSDKVTTELNKIISESDEVEAVLLTVRDGIILARKK